MMERNEDKHTCIYIILHEPESSAVTAVMALISRVSLNDLINWNFSMFCEVLLKLREFCLQYDNFDENR
jgi:hypothetical protein